MNPLPRRRFLATLCSLTAAAVTVPMPRSPFSSPSAAAETPRRRFTLDLTPGAIGVGGDLLEHLRLAHVHGFETVQPDTGYLARQDREGLARVRAALAEAGLKWGAAGLPVEFRQGDEAFRKDLGNLPRAAAALKEAGATRIGTWLMPGHNELEFQPNFDRHVARLKEVAGILRDHGLRLGLEYVGTPSIAARMKHPFVRRLAEARALITAIGVPGTGVILDSWHWWCAQDTPEALRQLRAADVIAVDLNDAPAGVALAEQQDNRRELPVATGVIPVRDFLGALVAIDYDGPVRAEPFNKLLNDLDNEAACARTIEALKKAVALLG